ncbi:MAG: hypothetical protein ACI8TQ_000063 [Planctomycetota bacterium]|jgi:hypothetical protein
MPNSTQKSSSAAAITTGLLLFALAALIRPRVIGYNLTPDGDLAGGSKILLIQGCQVVALLLGLICLIRGRVPVLPRGLVSLSNAALALLVVVAGYGNLVAARIIDPDGEMRAEVGKMVESEEVLLNLTPLLKKLGRSVANLNLPDHHSIELFQDELSVVDLTEDSQKVHLVEEHSLPFSTGSYETGSNTLKVAAGDLDLWKALLADVDYFEHDKFYFHHGDFGNEERDIWIGDTRFSGLARLKAGGFAAFHAKLKLTWVNTGLKDEHDKFVWRIGRFETLEAHSEMLDQKLFEEVTDQVLSPADQLIAERSIHEELVLEYLLQENPVMPYEDFQLPAFDRHPAVSIVDIDGDGLDDIYVMARHGANQLYRNTGDQHFEEVSAQYGLDIVGSCSAAIFGDFDNDGDKDLFLGRTRERTRYYQNDGGRFIDRSTELADVALPYMTSSIAAADYDGDGLLDIYISTYGSEAYFLDSANMDSLGAGMLLADKLSEEDARELWRQGTQEDGHKFLNRPGPPNLLLHNVGNGRFELAGRDAPHYLFRNTYQASFGDFDGDGDQDLYCANDFSVNNLYENDGSGNFVDATTRLGVADIGFGMGSDWGDYDNDGKLDLYVANMYSKAGQRITKQVSGLNPRFAQMARGNSLFKNQGDKFERVSGLKAPGLLVEAAGWGWGSQFVDFDNDSWLDIYTLSGFYTVPDAVALPLDL